MQNYISFLACSEYDGIVVPKLQREYVQGSHRKGKIFIESIFSCLVEDNDDSNKYLDLVYGTIDIKNKFMPIDGQQRLTTLFLLYWYIGSREGVLDNVVHDNKTLRTLLGKFSYDTRESSEKFCESLVSEKNGVDEKDFNFPDKTEKKNQEKFSDRIRNKAWYYTKYDYDPTIKSMLGMLNWIHSLYGAGKRTDQLYPKLDKRLRFNVLTLKNYSQGEELYTIMNDRGKPLSSFENLKSTLIGWMKENSLEHVSFAEKLDNVWCENIWKRAGNNEEKMEQIMYSFFCRFFYWYLMVYCDYDQRIDDIKNKLKPKKKPNALSDEEIEKIKIEEAYLEYCRKMLTKEDELDYSPRPFKYLLETLSKKLDDIDNRNGKQVLYDNLLCYLDFMMGAIMEPEAVSDFLTQYVDDNKQAKSICRIAEEGKESQEGNKIETNTIESDENVDAEDEGDPDNSKSNFTNVDRAVNFALALYVQKKKIAESNDTSWKNWKRFSWNIINSGRAVDSEENAVRVMKCMLDYSDSIDTLMTKLAFSDDKAFNAEEYEIRKAKYITDGDTNYDSDWYIAIRTAEKEFPYLKGNIDLLINDATIDEIEKFIKRKERLKKLLGENGLREQDGDDKYLVLRYLINKTGKDAVIPKNKTKKGTLQITSQETARGVLRTQLNSEWKEIIRHYINDDNVELEITQNSDIWAKDDNNPGNGIDVPEKLGVWHRRLSENERLVRYIQEFRKSAKDRPYLTVGTDLAKIMFGSNGRAFLDDDINSFIKSICDGFEKKGYYYDHDKLNVYHDENDGFYLYFLDYSQLEIQFYENIDDKKPKYRVKVTENQIISEKESSKRKRREISSLKNDPDSISDLIAWQI